MSLRFIGVSGEIVSDSILGDALNLYWFGCGGVSLALLSPSQASPGCVSSCQSHQGGHQKTNKGAEQADFKSKTAVIVIA